MSLVLLHALLASSAVAIACAMVSVFVIARRWAFLGEGVGHSGFGGVGIVALLAAMAPTLRGPGFDVLSSLAAVVVPVIAALGMGLLTRRGQISGDASIGIFLVACVAVGMVGQGAFQYRFNASPSVDLFFGDPRTVSTPFVFAAIGLCAAVSLVIVLLRREIIAYCLDPTLAQTAGVQVGLIHYLLITLIALIVVVGVRLVGILLVSALLVLPGATAGLLSRRFTTTLLGSVAVSLLGALAGVMIGWAWPFIPMGAAMVLVMFAAFCVAWTIQPRQPAG